MPPQDEETQPEHQNYGILLYTFSEQISVILYHPLQLYGPTCPLGPHQWDQNQHDQAHYSTPERKFLQTARGTRSSRFSQGTCDVQERQLSVYRHGRENSCKGFIDSIIPSAIPCASPRVYVDLVIAPSFDAVQTYDKVDHSTQYHRRMLKFTRRFPRSYFNSGSASINCHRFRYPAYFFIPRSKDSCSSS